MTSLRQQIWQVAADYEPFTDLVAGGTAGLFGSDTSPEPPAKLKDAPWFYLELLDNTASFDGSPNMLEGGFRWWGYDLPHAGYVRLRQALSVLAKAPGYLEAAGEGADYLYADTTTDELVFWQRPVGLGPETADQQRGLLLQWYTWQTRHSMRGDWP